MRDTGIVDKTGRAIKEHDIVTFMALGIGQTDKSRQTGYAKWCEPEGFWGLLSSSVLRGWSSSDFPIFDLADSAPNEVIGRYPQDMEMMK